MRFFVLSLLFVLFVLSVQVSAFEGKATLGSGLYLFEADTISHTKFYQSLRTSFILSKDNNKKISFFSNGRWRTDFSTKEKYDPQLNMYDAYFKFDNYIPNTKLKLGRHFVFTSIGTAVLDGFGIDTYLNRNIHFKISAGAFVNRLEPDKIQNFSENVSTISRIVYKYDKYKTGLNYIYKRINDDNEIHRAGLDLSLNRNSFSLYTRGTYDIELLQFYEFLIRGSVLKDKIYISPEFLYKRPSVSPNSVFAIIDAENYKRIRIDMHFNLKPKLKLISQFRNSFLDQDNIIGGYIGIATSQFSILYNYQNGQGTENSGFSGSISHKVNNIYSVYGSVNLSKYKIQDEVEETSESYSTAFGVARPVGKAGYIRLEYQFLRNAVESSNQRIYLKLNRQFVF